MMTATGLVLLLLLRSFESDVVEEDSAGLTGALPGFSTSSLMNEI
jgi:hypothetical protein